MIKKFEISGVHTNADEKLKKYVTKSVAKLERYMPRHARESAHVEVMLKENKSQSDKKCTAELIVYMPHGTLNAKEATVNMYAAVDIVEAKLISQLKKYKETHTNPHLLRRMTGRLRRRTA
ncbi:ribosome hibernation promoting factor [soil metagenome]